MDDGSAAGSGGVVKAPPVRGDGASWWVVQAAGSIAAASG